VRVQAYAYFKIDKYKGAYKELKTTNTFLFDLPMIGLAIATGATAIFSSNTDLIAGLALGIAGTTGLRQYFNNNGKAAYYFTAESKAQCVVNNSFIFTNADGKKDDMDAELKKIDKAINYSRSLSKNKKFEDADLKVELLKAIKTADSKNALGNKSIRTIEVSNEIIIKSMDNIALKLRGNINKATPNLDDITSKISFIGPASPSTTETEEEPSDTDEAEFVTPPPPADPCEGFQNEPKFCNCKNLEKFKANQLDANQYALYCILGLERISPSITSKSNNIINISTAIENCSKGS